MWLTIWTRRQQKNFQEAKELHETGKNNSEIARRLGVSRPTIVRWLDHDSYTDSRGWEQDVPRKHTVLEENRIVDLKKKRITGQKYFLGTPYIRMDYAKQYPLDSLPSTWFFDEVIRDHKLQTNEPKQRIKGQNIVSRLKFPITSIVKLGKIQQSIDFVGKKYIHGSNDPISIFSTSFYQWFQLYQIQRVLAEKVEYAVDCLEKFWTMFPLPNVLRMDNGTTWRGAVGQEACIGRFLIFLLNLNTIPLFSAAYQSYTNPHIEGHNRTVTEKLWSRQVFTDREEIDRECDRFNAESKEFFDYRFKERLAKKNLRYLTGTDHANCEILRSTKGKKIYFIRFVERWRETDNRIGIVILNRFVPIPEQYLNQYVLALLDLEHATIIAISEYDGATKVILQKPFPFSIF